MGAHCVVSIPGPVEMDGKNSENNIYVSEAVWIHFVQWYSLHKSHELTRKRTADVLEIKCNAALMIEGNIDSEKEFKVWLPEEVGYIELMLRRIFNVPPTARSRLWVRKHRREMQYHGLLPLADRSKVLCACVRRQGDNDNYNFTGGGRDRYH